MLRDSLGVPIASGILQCESIFQSFFFWKLVIINSADTNQPTETEAVFLTIYKFYENIAPFPLIIIIIIIVLCRENFHS